MRGSELGEHTSCGVEEKQSTTSDGSILFAQPARYPARAMVRVGGGAVRVRAAMARAAVAMGLVTAAKEAVVKAMVVVVVRAAAHWAV